MMTRSLRIFAFILLVQVPGSLSNKPPVFTSDLNNYVITENTPVGTIIYTLKATDPEDSPLKYGIMGTDKFTVGERSGHVTVNKPIDREVANKIKFSVTVEDVVGEDGTENNVVAIPVIVNVLDVNDNPPVFQNQSSLESIVVTENTKVGTKIVQVSVSDDDMTGLALSLNCTPTQQSPEACEMFHVETKESTAGYLHADIKLARKLNYNQRRLYQFVLSCSDGEHISSVPVLIQIEDNQNTGPHFTGSMSGRVGEQANAGSVVMVVKAKDGDLGKPRDVKLTLLKNPADAFQLDSSTGHLTTTRPLDREVLGSVLELKVKAEEIVGDDEAKDKQSDDDITETIENLTILIDDVNDFTPQFNRKEYWTDIDENSEIGTPLADIDMEIVDLDAGTNAEFTIRVDGPLSEYFDVQPTFAKGYARPVISVKKKFDFENPNERKFLILIIAQNTEDPKLFSTATITVVTNDLNDNAPKFEKQVYTITVPESVPAGTLLGSITAHDSDSKELGTEGLRYQLVGVGSKKFRVNEKTGDIYLNSCTTGNINQSRVTVPNCLDYEAQNTFDLLLTAHDNHKQDGSVHTIVPLQIRLSDSNDNSPTFVSRVHRTISENSDQFEPRFFVQAEDVDDTAVLTYRIMEPQPPFFGMDKLTGEVIIKSPTLPPGNYSFRVEVSDSIHKAYTTVVINVNDINNNAPVFDVENMETDIMIPENYEVGNEVTTVLATDEDLEANGLVYYSLERGGYGFFSVDKITGAVTLTKALKFYEKSYFQLHVRAYDQGKPSLSSFIVLNVQVLNVYQKLPKVFPPVQRAQISSSTKKGDVVMKVETTGGTFKNSSGYEFHFALPVELRTVDNKLSSGPSQFHEWFDILPSGEIIARTTPKRDLISSLNYTVILTSRYTEENAREYGTVILSLYEVNDHPPSIDDMEIEIEEELPVGMTIITLDTEDPERGHSLSYSVIDGDNYISVDNKTGEVKVAGRLDYDEKPTYNCTLTVVDSGVPPLSSTATIVIHLLNINDNTPSFNQSEYIAEVDEHADAGTFVTQVFASDKDSDVVTYDIVPGKYSRAFEVDRLGRITVSNEGSRILDREIIGENGIIAFGVGAKDGARVGYTMVTLLVRDINDILPKILRKSYAFSVYTPLVAMQQLGAIHGESGDLPSTDQIKYSVVPLSGTKIDDVFIVEENTGIIRTNRAFDKPGEYRMTVEAADSPGNASIAITEVVIKVLQNNLMRPEFIFPNKGNWTLQATESDAAEIKKFQEDSTWSKPVGEVQAFDGDDGSNGAVSYFFMDREGRLVSDIDEFRINETSGEILQVKPLDRERINVYNLVVAAKDGGEPVPGVQKHVLSIEIHDVDDHAPHFYVKFHNFSIKENSPPNSFVGQVVAHDEDVGQNGQIFYFLASDETNRYKNEDLRVDIKTGKLFSQAILDKERISEYQLFVRASPSPIVSKISQRMTLEEAIKDESIAIVTIKVIDENDNPVKFTKKQYYAAVNAEAEPGRAVLDFTVEDVDSSSKGAMQFFLHGSNLIVNDFQSGGSLVPSPFRVDETNGRLTISSSALRQYGGGNNRFMVHVGVKETVAPFHEDKAIAHVWVVDMSQQVIVTVKTHPEAVNIQELADILSNITDTAVLVTKVTPHVTEDLSVNHKWSDVFLAAVSKKTMKIVPVSQFLQSLDLATDKLYQQNKDMELYSALPALGTSDSVEYLFANRDSFDTAFAGLVALVALLCLSLAAMLAVCCCLNHIITSRRSEKENMQGGMKYPLHPNESLSGTPSLSRHAKGSHEPDIMEDLATDNPLWTDHNVKTYEEQELTMCVTTEMETSTGTETEDNKSASDSVHDHKLPSRDSPMIHQAPSLLSHAYATLHRGTDHRKDYDHLLIGVGHSNGVRL